MELIERAVSGDAEAGRLLFPIIVEPLADAFDPDLCNVYVGVFSCIFGRMIPELAGVNLIERFERVRATRRFTGPEPSRVFVLSRVTLGADVAVTSIVLDAAKKRFPHAQVFFVGPRKNYELFAGDERIAWLDAPYQRSGSLEERLSVWPKLRELIDHEDALVIDPDSRLTQLGLLPVCAEERYLFFESRAYGADSDASLVELTGRWLAETLGVEDARASVRPAAGPVPHYDVTVSLGVGENENKRVADPFETELLRLLGQRFGRILVDSGQGGEEAERVRRAIADSGVKADVFEGPFAEFAAHIACSARFVGYDSAGGHVAAAAGTPLVSIFAGALCQRTFDRWRPTGPASAEVVLVQPDDTPSSVLDKLRPLLL